LLSSEEATVYFHRSPRTLRRWEQRGRLIPVRIPGGGKYYRAEDIRRLIAAELERAVRRRAGLAPEADEDPP
jgi:DNA-binding transcriptional MerR regulator